MVNRNIARAVRTALISAAAIGAGIQAAPVVAQEKLGEIVVTGSRISRDEYTAESPISVVTREDLTEYGHLDLGEALRTNIAVTGGFSKSNVLSGGGAQSIDLRNLGTDRVLTLINGRRVSRFADGLQNESIDLSLIPLAMIDRIEILRDGASAAYGADAVSGVVNVILRDDFEGFELNATTGISTYSDAEEYAVQGVFGSRGESGNLVLSLETRHRDNVRQIERDWAFPSIVAISGTGVTNGSGAHPGGLAVFAAVPSLGLPSRSWCTQPSAFGGDERTNVFGTPACPNNAPSDPNDLIGRYDYALQQDIINAEKQVNAAAIGSHAFSDNVEAFIELIYSRRDTDSNLDANPIFAGQGSPAFPGGWVIPADNPYNPFPGQSAQYQVRPTSTVGPRSQTFEATLLRSVVGLKGSDLFDKFDWEVSYLNSEVLGHTETDATFNLRRAITISNPALCAADPNCSAALAPGSLGALDVYRPGNWSQSEIDYFRQVATTDSEFTMEGVQAVVSGELLELPAGGLGIAVGAEWRDETADFKPDSVTEAGESIANQTFSTNGSFDVKEMFVEVNVPLLANVAGAQELSLNLQGRYFDYSTFGDDTVYKIGLNYAPIDSLRIRGTYGTSFRAPTLVDSFSGGTVSFDFIDDPCNNWNLSTNPTIVANCGPGGANLPAGFTQSAAQLPVLAGGDLADGIQNLGPEQADSWTVGIVFQPAGLEGFRASVDYWDFVVSDFIDRPDLETEVVGPCYASAGRSAPECALFSRNPVTGNLTNLVSGAFNREGETKTNGLDWAIEYSGLQVGPGSLTLQHQGTYVMEYEQPGVTVGPGEVDFASPFAIPEFRLNFGADYELQAYSFGMQTRYISKLDNLRLFNGNADGDNFLGYDGASEHVEVDLRARWKASEMFTATFGVNNVLDEDPEYIFSTGQNTSIDVYGSAVTGRWYFLQLKAEF